jgi:hypothetical protein
MFVHRHGKTPPQIYYTLIIDLIVILNSYDGCHLKELKVLLIGPVPLLDIRTTQWKTLHQLCAWPGIVVCGSL